MKLKHVFPALVLCSLAPLSFAALIEKNAKLGEGVDEQVVRLVVENLRSQGFPCQSVSGLTSKKAPARFFLSCDGGTANYVITHNGNNFWTIDFSD